jgi:hypothetical protein
MMRWLVAMLLGLLAACSERPAGQGGGVRWDGRAWHFPDGREVTAESLTGGGEVWEVVLDERATVAASAVWLEGARAGWKRLRLGEMTPVEWLGDVSRTEVGLMLEPARDGFHLLIRNAEAEMLFLPAAGAEELFKEAVGKAGPLPSPCAILLPDDSVPLTPLAAALKLSQCAGPRPVGFVMGFSLLDQIAPPPVPEALDPAKGIPVRIAADGTLRVGDSVIDEERLGMLIRGLADAAPGTHLRLHGRKDAMFRHSRRVIRLAGSAGVDRVAFVTHDPDRDDSCDDCRDLPAAVAGWLATHGGAAPEVE